jgi:hypothetical protein
MDQLSTPNQPGVDAVFGDGLEEPAEDLKPVPFADAGQAGVIGKHFGQIVAEIPAQTEPVGHHPHELPLGAQPLEEEHQLEFEEDHRVDTRPADRGIGLPDQIADKSEVEFALQVAIGMVRWDKVAK